MFYFKSLDCHIYAIIAGDNGIKEMKGGGNIMMLIPIVGIILVYLWVTGDGKKVLSRYDDSSERILKERFVNGEIDEETYLKMKSVLKK